MDIKKMISDFAEKQKVGISDLEWKDMAKNGNFLEKATAFKTRDFDEAFFNELLETNSSPLLRTIILANKNVPLSVSAQIKESGSIKDKIAVLASFSESEIISFFDSVAAMDTPKAKEYTSSMISKISKMQDPSNDFARQIFERVEGNNLARFSLMIEDFGPGNPEKEAGKIITDIFEKVVTLSTHDEFLKFFNEQEALSKSGDMSRMASFLLPISLPEETIREIASRGEPMLSTSLLLFKGGEMSPELFMETGNTIENDEVKMVLAFSPTTPPEIKNKLMDQVSGSSADCEAIGSLLGEYAKTMSENIESVSPKTPTG